MASTCAVPRIRCDPKVSGSILPLNYIIIIKAKVLLPQVYVNMADFDYPL
jgi:hypothetical protein